MKPRYIYFPQVEYKALEKSFIASFSPEAETYSSMEVHAGAREVTFEDLEPSSKYEFKVSAATAIGPGEATVVVRYTKLAGKLEDLIVMVILFFIQLGIVNSHRGYCFGLRNFPRMA